MRRMQNALWNDLAARAGLALTDAQHGQFSRYLDLLFDANQWMNLTRIADRPQAELQHVADSLTLLPHLPKQMHRIADVGSGGGVPGIPLAIARPDCRVTLIEATKKKAAFLQSAAAQLGLANVRVVELRAEEVGQMEHHRDTYNVAVARAVATMAWLAEWCLPLVQKGGKMLAMKGPKVQEELPLAARAILWLNGADPVVHPVDLPGTEHRVIVEIQKTGGTDPKYPRDATVAKGKPLGQRG